MMMMMRQQPQPGQFVIDELKDSFQIVTVEATATELPAGLDALAVIHRKTSRRNSSSPSTSSCWAAGPVFRRRSIRRRNTSSARAAQQR